jgi:hypothetical protein
MIGYTVFFTYRFLTDTSFGYSDAVHCNYINSLQIQSVLNSEVNLYFTSVNDFKFLTAAYGATEMQILLQVVNNSSYNNISSIIPAPNAWKVYDVTDQIRNYVDGIQITAVNLVATVFKLPLNAYNAKLDYNLSYKNYSSPVRNDSTLNFGDEEIFLGNVTTSIEAIAHSTEIDIHLPLDGFNISTNKTWDGLSTLMISEIGIYNADHELVAIAKLNNPILKDSTLARTLVFGIDF